MDHKCIAVLFLLLAGAVGQEPSRESPPTEDERAARIAARAACDAVTAWLEQSTPDREERVRALGTKGVDAILVALPHRPGDRAREAGAATRTKRLLDLLPRIAPKGTDAFDHLKDVALTERPEDRALFFDGLAALAPIRRSEDRLTPAWIDEATATDALDPATAVHHLVRLSRSVALVPIEPCASAQHAIALLESRSPWRVERAIEALAACGAEARQALPALRALVARPDPRIYFTTRRIPLRRAAAKLVLALEPEAADAKQVRGVLLGEAPTQHSNAVPETMKARVAELVAELAHEDRRSEALANLLAFEDFALPLLAEAVTATGDAEHALAIHRAIRNLAPRAGAALPPLLDSIERVSADQQPELLHTIACIAPWSLDRILPVNVDRDRYWIARTPIDIQSSPAAADAFGFLRIAIHADGACSVDELRNMLRDDDLYVRDVGVAIASGRRADAERLLADLEPCLEAKQEPPAIPFVNSVRAPKTWHLEHRRRAAELVSSIATEGSAAALRARSVLADLDASARTAREEQRRRKAAAMADELRRMARDGAYPTEIPAQSQARAIPRDAANEAVDLHSLVAELAGPDHGRAETLLLRSGPKAAAALAERVGADASRERAIARLAFLRRIGPAAATEFETLQREARHRPLRCPDHFAATLAALAPYRPDSVELRSTLPLRVHPSDDCEDPEATGRRLERIEPRLRARAEVRASDSTESLLGLLRSRRPYRVQVAVELLTGRGASAAAAVPLLQQIARRPDPRVLRTDEVVPLCEAAIAALRAIDASADVPPRSGPGPTTPASSSKVTERIGARVRELVAELADPTRHDLARDNLVALGPAAQPALAALAKDDTDLLSALRTLDVLLDSGADTSIAANELLEALAAAPKERRVHLLVLLALVAPWSRDVVLPPSDGARHHLRLFDVALARDVDLLGFEPIREAAKALGTALEVDPGGPAREVAAALESQSCFTSLHALLAVKHRPGEFANHLGLLEKQLGAEPLRSRPFHRLDDRTREWLASRFMRAVAEAVLAQARPGSELAARARTRLDELDALPR